MTNEIKTKLRRLRALMARHKVHGLLISNRTNFAWLTGGRDSHVRWDSEKGVGSLWVTAKDLELWCNPIEDKRFREEEFSDLPIPFKVHPWNEPPNLSPQRHRDAEKGPAFLKPGIKKITTDDGSYGLPSLRNEIARLRWTLLPVEIERYREVGKKSGEAMQEVGFRIRKGWTENQVAGELTKELIVRGLEAPVILVGADERLQRYRHPIQTNHKIENTVMMVVCARGHGLIADLTRVVHFGPMSMDLQMRHRACLQVECAMLAKTKPGAEAREAFQAAVNEYNAQGYTGEWKKHHQGGLAGYDTREYLATPDCREKFEVNQTIAWNVSITGTKTEDTFVIGKKGLDLLTPTPQWPMVKVKFAGKDYLRPDILLGKK
jgi:Xaa-Pro aminopeptidase